MEVLVKLLTRTKYYGLEYVPVKGRVIIATNHMSRVDIPLLGVIPTRKGAVPLVTDKYKSNLLLRIILGMADSIWLDRTKADFTAFRAAFEKLEQGYPLGIAPEGTRSPNGELIEGKSGVILLAVKSKTPIVPVGIAGTEDAVEKLIHLQRPEITVRFGEAFTIPELPRENRDEALKKATDEVMCRIAALLPEKYHGYYAGYPRIKELQMGGSL